MPLAAAPFAGKDDEDGEDEARGHGRLVEPQFKKVAMILHTSFASCIGVDVVNPIPKVINREFEE